MCRFQKRKGKNPYFALHFKKGRVQALKCYFIEKFHSFIQIRTHSSGIHVIFMDFWARSVPKIALFENFGTKNHNFRQISHQNFRNNPFISIFRQSAADKRLQSFEAQPEGFPKTISSKVAKGGTFLKIATCKQKYSKKYRYVKNGHLWDFGPKFRFFFFKCHIATSLLVVLCKIWSHFCCEP